MNCEAISRRSGRQCGNEAEIERAGIPVCELHGKMHDEGRELATLRGALTGRTGDDSPDSSPPATATGADTAPDPAPLQDIPPAPDPEETPQERPAQPAPDLGELDRIAGELKILTEPAAAPGNSPALGPQNAPQANLTAPAAGAAPRPQLWTPEKVAEWIAWANPWMERAGLRPLTPQEIKSGGEAWAEPFNIILARIDPNNPWIGAIAWSAVTLAPRAIEKGRQLAEAKAAQEGDDGADVQELRPRSSTSSKSATSPAATSWAPDRGAAA